MVKFADRRVKEVEIKDVEELLNAPLNGIQMIKGGLTVESNLSELVEEVDLDTKIHITENEVEIPVGRLVYDKLKGKKVTNLGLKSEASRRMRVLLLFVALAFVENRGRRSCRC